MPTWRRALRCPLRRAFNTVAAREGVLLKYADGDPETVRLVETHAGQALAAYEIAAKPPTLTIETAPEA